MQTTNPPVPLDQQYYYGNGQPQISVPYSQYQQPASYYPDHYVMGATGQHAQPMMMPLGQQYIYMAQSGMPQVAPYPSAYYAPAHPVYYSDMPQPMYATASPQVMNANGGAQPSGSFNRESSSVRPLSTSTPLPPEFTGCPPPMTNQVPYTGNLYSAHLKYHKSMENDYEDPLANVSKISMEYADDTMCDSHERVSDVTPQPEHCIPAAASLRRVNLSTPANFKTRMCMTFAAGKECEMGERCKFAHGTHQLRHVEGPPRAPNMRYKTRLCKNYLSATADGIIPFCPYGLRCEFIHPTDREFALLPPHVRNQISPSVLAVTNPCDITPDMNMRDLGEYQHPPTATRSAVKVPTEKVLLKNKKSGSMMCLASNMIGRRELGDDSAIGSGSSESSTSAQSGRARGRAGAGMLPKFLRRRSMSNINLDMKRWNSSEALAPYARA